MIPTESRTAGLSATTRLAAVGFAATYFASMVLTDVPDLGDSDAAARSFYAVPSHRMQAVVAMYVLCAATACFVVLMAGLVGRLRARGGSVAAEVALAAGTTYAALSLTAGAAFAAPAASITLGLGGGTAVDPGFARSASTLGDVLMLLAAPLACSLFVAAVCAGARRTGILPSWLWAAGFVVAAALLAGAVWFPLLLLLGWALTLAVVRSRPVPVRAPAQPVGSGSR